MLEKYRLDKTLCAHQAFVFHSSGSFGDFWKIVGPVIYFLISLGDSTYEWHTWNQKPFFCYIVYKIDKNK